MAKPNGVSEEFTRAYKKLPSISIDHGVMERSSRSAVIPVTFTWSDVGNWDLLWSVSEQDKEGNVSQGQVILWEVKGKQVIKSFFNTVEAP